MMTKPLVAVVLTLLIGLVLGVLTLTPVSAPPVLPGTDKVYHVIGFSALTLPVAVFWRRALVPMVVLAIAYGGAIELIQPYVGRSREFGDFVADGVGAVLGALIGLGLAQALSRYSPAVRGGAVRD